MEQELISIIIPTYNSSSYLQEAISSVLQQTYINKEIIVVDDGSDDNTIKILDDFIKQKKIIFLKKENGGPATARNLGIKYATGDYIALLDADDIWSIDKLEKQINFLEKNHLDLVHTGRFLITQEEKKDWLTYSKQNIKNLIKKNYITTSSVLAKSKILKNNPFNEDIKLVAVEDYDLWLRLAFKKYQFGYLAEKLTGYRIHKDQISSTKNLNNLLYLYKINISQTNNYLYKLLLLYMYLKIMLYKFRLKTKIT